MFYSDVAMDLGTANILISTPEHGIVLREPSLIAMNSQGKMVGIGEEAWQVHEKTHRNLRTLRPLRDGVISDFEAAEQMIRGMIKRVKSKWYTRIRHMVIGVPSGITEVERQAVRVTAEHSGARYVQLIDEPMAAAIGIGIQVHKPEGHMIVDIGGGTTEIAVIALSELIQAQSLRLAGDRFTEDIISYFRRHHNLLIGERTAEAIKCKIASAAPLKKEIQAKVKGRDLVNGVPKIIPISSEEIRTAIKLSVNSVVEAIIKSLEQTPPELSSDIYDNGITLVGGGALIKNLDQRIKEETQLPVHVAEDPLTAVIRGAGAVLESTNGFKPVLH